MKQVLSIALLTLLVFVVGLTMGSADANRVHAGDYGRGYDAGVVAATRPTAETKVVGNMLCRYAALACGGGK